MNPYGVGVVMVKKNTSDEKVKFRMTLDYRLINEKTIAETSPRLFQ
jgi:hypothetical protein